MTAASKYESNRAIAFVAPEERREFGWPVIAAILIGFPLFFYGWAQVLLRREAFTIPGVDFFVTFWIATSAIYAAKILIVKQVLDRHGWSLEDLGIPGSKTRRKIVLIYAVLALITFLGFEVVMRSLPLDPAKLRDLPGLYPETSAKRAALLLLAFFTGISEELTYRGFAISAFVRKGLNRWLAVGLAAFPFVFQHGLKIFAQFWWFLGNGLVLGALYVFSRHLLPPIIIHWAIIWLALLGPLTALAD